MTTVSTGDDENDWRWLTSGQAEPYLAEVAGATAASLLASSQRLRRALSSERARLVLQQAALRQKARDKFPEHARMFFTPQGLEQATDAAIALYKTSRFATGQPVFDLCCGIGGDLLALAQRGPATGIDRDPSAVLVAQANCRALGLAAAEVHVADVTTVDLAQCAAWHLDPDRRATGQRTTRVELHEPGAGAIQRMLGSNPNAALKLAAAAEWPAEWTEQAEWEWIGRDRQCRQLVAWFGNLAARHGARRATIVDTATSQPRTLIGQQDLQGAAPAANALDAYLFEPHAAVLAAQLTAVLAAEHNLRAIAPGAAYLTGPRPIADAALATFQIIEAQPYRLGPLKALLRSRDIGRLEIKKRGVDHDPEQVRRQLALRGERSATLLITRIGQRVMAILAERCTTA